MTKARRYDPEFNRSYVEFAEHYSLAVLPARVRRPRDKAAVENGVLIAERRILGALRDRQFFSLAELNSAIAEIVTAINTEPFQKREGSIGWREHAQHHKTQLRGRFEIFLDYRLRVASVIRDYGMFERDQAPQVHPPILRGGNG